LLGAYGQLAVVSQTATHLVVNLPPGISAGSYSLSVQIGGKANVDESVVTIAGAGGGASASLNVILRDSWRTLVLAPGAIQGVASICLPGEIALSGGPTSIPGPPAFIYYSTLIWDGNNSGWDVEYGNSGATSIVITPRTTVSCVPGTLSKP